MIEASCHCGAVRLAAPRPEWVSNCNCSICRRLGAWWAYCSPDQASVTAAPEAFGAYSHGDRMIAFHHCRTCGCTTHWTSLRADYSDRMAVNARLFAPADMVGVRVRRFDGAVSWTHLDP